MKPIRGGLLSAVGALLLLALSPAISSATFPGANGRIAYSCDTDDISPSDICTILPDGSGMERIADVGGSPSWSANGRHLVFVRDGQVFTMDADGGDQTQITYGDAPKGMPGFSPNGRWIVFVKQIGGYDTRARVSLWKARTDGTDQHRIVSHLATGPMYSQSGRRIIFQGRPRGAARDGIWKIRPDGSHLRRLTNPGEDYYDALIDLSPSGGHILFWRCNWVERYSCKGAFVMRPDGSHKHPINSPGGVYSPSGRRFADVAAEVDPIFGTSPCSDIQTMRLNGSDVRALTHNCEDLASGGDGGFAGDPDWQPIPQP